ncbi:hypothetical protein OH805_37555 [Streptomyces sp. NBC_00879]|uniref:hypothetical protein n=1 Tax=Streptomyces sp. NBC_00879 TaxID=2975855 RepID=UPI003867798B|nr:hypothetical protein OH805_37555 [Streptomyces sp. NBC_00879]
MHEAGPVPLDLRFESELPTGVLEGHAVIVVRPPADLDPASGVVLRLRLFCARITSLHRRTASSSPGDPLEDVSARLWAEQPHILICPLDPLPASDAWEYHLRWAITPSNPGFGAVGEQCALFAVRLLARHPDTGDRMLAAGGITAAWDSPHPVRDLKALAHLGAHGRLPRPLADAIADLAGANEPSVPSCGYCALYWELELLTYTDRVRDLAEHHGETEVAELLARWDPGQGLDHPGRRYHRPCRCQRLRLGARPEAHEDWRAETGDEWWSPDPHTRERLEARMRQQVTAARLRHLAHRHRILGDI